MASWDLIVDIGATILLWVVVSLYLAGDLYWLYEVLVYAVRYEQPERSYGPEDVQVRLLTIDAEAVVRESVAALPAELDDRVVIAEEPIDVPGADVHVVPDDFECAATNKGRALEWARRHVPCDREFLLYLDEDSHVLEFNGLPDADIVQLREQPRRTSSLLSYFAEINRIGFQIEQRAFPSVAVPLYAWGGGIAIRSSIEDEITWDYPTVIEDTVFLWRAFVEADATYAYVLDRVSNQAPPSVWAMFRQRRRWIAGAREDNDILSLDRVVMYGIRDLSWSVTGTIPLLALISVVPMVDLYFFEAYRGLSLALLALLVVWVVIGLRRYDPSIPTAIAVLVLSPVTTVLHSAGAMWGLVSPPTTFEVTRKVEESDVEEADEVRSHDATAGAAGD